MTGKELKSIVQQSGIKQSEIARRMGVTPQSLNANFNAKDVRSETIKKVAVALGMELQDIIQQCGITQQSPPITDEKLADSFDQKTYADFSELMKRTLDMFEHTQQQFDELQSQHRTFLEQNHHLQLQFDRVLTLHELVVKLNASQNEK